MTNPNKTKAIVQIGFTNYVLDVDKAVALTELLTDCEIYEEKWRKQEEGGPTYHVYPQDSEKGMLTLKVIPKTFYNMAKMAGKPEDKN